MIALALVRKTATGYEAEVCDPRPNRTVNLLLRRELLYPIELWDQIYYVLSLSHRLIANGYELSATSQELIANS